MSIGLWRRGVGSFVLVWHLLAGSAAAAEIFWGLTANDTLVRFSSAAPGTILATRTVTGLPGGDPLVAIEVEEDIGRLTGVTRGGRRYQIDRLTGAATPLNPAQ